ncbi:MAG: type II toxin-antitoxin system VapC family toxin [Candidatus Hadarchaeota archaeon]
MIVLDTDVLIEIYDKRSKEGESIFKKISESGETAAIAAVNLHEILFGLRKYEKPAGEVVQLPVLSYSKEDASLAAELELKAEKRGTPVLRTDAMIAAMAINNGAKLHTLNLRHFKPLETFGLELFK